MFHQNSPAKLDTGRWWAIAAIIILSTGLAYEVALDCHAVVIANHGMAPLWPSLIYGLTVWWWWGALTCLFYVLLRRWSTVSELRPRLILLYLLVGIAIVLAHALALRGIVSLDVYLWPNLRTVGFDALNFLSLRRLGSEFLLFGFIVGIGLAVQFYLRNQEQRLRATELERQLSQAKLHALQMQVDPHFLFNTLNSLTALVKFDQKDDALQTLENLNALLRTTLASESPARVALGNELEMIENYLAIEQVRFADRLRVNMTIDPDALRGLVPCFLLQPLVENAIRHGIAHCEGDGVVEASVQRAGSELHLSIRDNGPGRTNEVRPGHGIGLKNTRERLAHFYRDKYALRAAPLPTGGFEVFISIPFEQQA